MTLIDEMAAEKNRLRAERDNERARAAMYRAEAIRLRDIVEKLKAAGRQPHMKPAHACYFDQYVGTEWVDGAEYGVEGKVEIGIAGCECGATIRFPVQADIRNDGK